MNDDTTRIETPRHTPVLVGNVICGVCKMAMYERDGALRCPNLDCTNNGRAFRMPMFYVEEINSPSETPDAQ